MKATLKSATETNSIPKDWKVVQDNFDPEADVSNLDFSTSVAQESEGTIDSQLMLERAKQNGVFGSLGLAKVLFAEQIAKPDIIPTEFQGKYYVIFPDTILEDAEGDSFVPFLWWGEERQEWYIDFRPMADGFNSADRFIKLIK